MISSGLYYLYIFLQSAGLESLYLFSATRNKNATWKLFLINAISHPVVIYFFFADGRFSYIQAAIWGEAFAVISEALMMGLFIFPKRWHYCLGLSLVANLISWQLAPFLSYAFNHLIT